MNKKRTNYLVAILNIIAIVSIYIMYFSKNYIQFSMFGSEAGAKSIYNSCIIEILINNMQLILALIHGGLGILNIICAIQNKKNKKICFWQLVFAIYEIWSSIAIVVFLDNKDIIEGLDRIICGIIPIILAIINLISIKKNKPKTIQIISYVVVIIIAILDILDIITILWNVVAIIMQFIYIHYQEKNTIESNTRKIVNIILYYVLQLILVAVFVMMIMFSLLTTKINEIKWYNDLNNIYDSISKLDGVTIKDVYIPVEKDSKYGFINENGQEKIHCEYDRVSFFNEIEINNITYYVALAKKENKFYIISKNNDNIVISNDLQKYIQTAEKYVTNPVIEYLGENYHNGYLQSFEILFQILTRVEKRLTYQTLENNDNKIILNERNNDYYYKNGNYSMLIEPMYDEQYETDYDDYFYNEEDEILYNVTITKNNGEKQSSIVSLPGIDEYASTLNTFTNGYIEFEDEGHTRKGWYDNNGNKTTISNKYIINDIKDDKVFLQIDNNKDDIYNMNSKQEDNFIIIDMTGKTLLKTTLLDTYDNISLIKNTSNKMVIINKELKEISNEYDKIITNSQIDISSPFSSYYKNDITK